MKSKSLRSLLVPSANRQSCALFAIALSTLLASQSASAATRTWSGTTGVNWDTGGLGGNWTDLAAPVAGDTLAFAGTTNTATNNNIAADTSFAGISFTNTLVGESFSLGGNRITLGGNIVTTTMPASPAASTITDTISLDMILSNNRIITPNTRHNLIISGIISDSASGYGFNKTGQGTLTLNGANTFSGLVTLSAGFLNVNSIADSGSSALGFGPLNLNAGQLTYTGDTATSTNRTITLGGGATINTAPTTAPTLPTSTLTLTGTFTTATGGPKAITFAGGNTGANTVASLLADGSALADVLTVIKNGGGTWALTNTNTFTGPLFLNQGILTVNSIADGGTPCNIGAGTSIRFGNAGSTGTLIYTGAAQTINRTVQIGNNANPPAATDIGGGMIQNDGAGLLTFNATPVFNTPLDTASGTGANRVLTLKGLNNGKITGIIQDNTNSGGGGTTNIGVTKAGAGTWTLEGANTYSGATIVSEGTLTISGSRNVNTGLITVGGSAVTSILNLQNTGTYATGVITIGTNGSTSTINQSAGTITAVGGSGLIIGNNATATNATYALSGTGSLGSVTPVSIIMGVNTPTGAPHVTNFNLSGSASLNASTLRIGRYDAINSLALNSDNTFAQSGGTATVTNLGLGGNAVDAALTNPIVAKLNLTGGTFSATNFASLSAGGANTSAITIGGSAQVTLPAFPTVRGTDSTATLTFDGGTLIPAAASATYMSGLTNAFITANGAKIDVPTGRDITIAQALENAPSAVGTLTKSGVGTLILTGANTYTGNTTVVDGILDISSTYLADTSTLTIGTVAASPAVLHLPNAGTDTVAALVIDGVTQSPGLYDSTNSGGAITGTGKIQVPGVSNTYANWLVANAPATGFSNDTDKDGVPNGVENVLGTNPNTFSAGLTQVSATANSVTYQHTLNPTIASDVSYSYQWSTDLTEWKASGVANTAGTIGTIVPSAPVSGVVTVTTTRTGTPSTKLFTRIKAGNP